MSLFHPSSSRKTKFSTARVGQRSTETKSLESWLSEDTKIPSVLLKAKQCLQLQYLIEKQMTSPLFKHCQVIDIEEEKQEITLSAPNAALAAKLRQFIPSLCQTLHEQGIYIQQVHIKIVNPR